MTNGNNTINQLELLDISNIEGVRFFPKEGESFSVSLDSIKRITFYLIDKYEKVKFKPWELKEERDFFLEHYKSSLSAEEHKLVVDALTKWVNEWWRVEILYAKSSWTSRILILIIVWWIYLPFGFVWWALTGMWFDAPGSDRDIGVLTLFFLLNWMPFLGMLWFSWKRLNT